MQRRFARAAVAAAPQALAVERDQVGRIGPKRQSPVHEASFEQLRIDPVEQRPQPVLARNPEEILGVAPQERQVQFAPIGDLVVVVASSHAGAGDQKQHLPQRIADLGRFARVRDTAEVIQQQRQAVPDENRLHGRPPRESDRP